MNCSVIVRQMLGKTPTEPWVEPSGFCSAKPTIPGGRQGCWSNASIRSITWLINPLAISTSGFNIEQPITSSELPSGIDAHGETAIIRPDKQPQAGAR